MSYTQNLPLSKDFFLKGKNHDKITTFNNYATIDSNNNESCSMSNQEAESVKKAKEALSSASTQEVPTFQNNEIAFPKEFVLMVSRIVTRVHEEILMSERWQNILSKANEYHIPYSREIPIDWLGLESKVEEYEQLIAKAKEMGLNWDYSCYDPVGLEQAIEECEHSLSLGKNDLYAYFRSTRGVEV